MACFNSTTILVFLLVLSLHLLISSPTISARRNLSAMEGEEEEDPPLKPPPKKKTIQETKNHTNLTKAIKPKKSNSTTTPSLTKIKPGKLNKTLSATTKPSLTKIKPGKLNKTLSATTKPSNSTKLIKPSLKSNSTKIPLNSTTKPLKSAKKSQIKPQDLALPSKKKNTTTITTKSTAAPTIKKKMKSDKNPSELGSWLDEEMYSDVDSDFIAEFRGLPGRILPDLERLSITSRAYISLANKGITEGVKPYVGHRYAPTIASAASAGILVLPLLLLTLLIHHLRSYLSLQRVLIFVQAYLAIYFATLAVTALATGLEPLRFFYAASPGSYACTQAMQTMGYVMYLLAQAVHMVAAFSTSAAEGGGGGGERGLALAQMVVGLAVGMHYYVVVFHRAAAGEPPRANWRVHAVYAAGFLVICACARAERRKKAYLPLDGSGDEGKKS